MADNLLIDSSRALSQEHESQVSLTSERHGAEKPDCFIHKPFSKPSVFDRNPKACAKLQDIVQPLEHLTPLDVFQDNRREFSDKARRWVRHCLKRRQHEKYKAFIRKHVNLNRIDAEREGEPIRPLAEWENARYHDFRRWRSLNPRECVSLARL